MKRLTFLIVALLLLPSVVYSELPRIGYIGLFSDDNHSGWCIEGTGVYTFEMWIWCLPSSYGLFCAEFRIDYPEAITQSTVTKNTDIISVELGDLASGWSVCFPECILDEWIWPAHQTLYVTDDSTPMEISVVEHPLVGEYYFANCDFDTEPIRIIASLYINFTKEDFPCMVMGVEESSWGAIKSMMSK